MNELPGGHIPFTLDEINSYCDWPSPLDRNQILSGTSNDELVASCGPGGSCDLNKNKMRRECEAADYRILSSCPGINGGQEGSDTACNQGSNTRGLCTWDNLPVCVPNKSLVDGVSYTASKPAGYTTLSDHGINFGGGPDSVPQIGESLNDQYFQNIQNRCYNFRAGNRYYGLYRDYHDRVANYTNPSFDDPGEGNWLTCTDDRNIPTQPLECEHAVMNLKGWTEQRTPNAGEWGGILFGEELPIDGDDVDRSTGSAGARMSSLFENAPVLNNTGMSNPDDKVGLGAESGESAAILYRMNVTSMPIDGLSLDDNDDDNDPNDDDWDVEDDAMCKPFGREEIWTGSRWKDMTVFYSFEDNMCEKALNTSHRLKDGYEDLHIPLCSDTSANLFPVQTGKGSEMYGKAEWKKAAIADGIVTKEQIGINDKCEEDDDSDWAGNKRGEPGFNENEIGGCILPQVTENGLFEADDVEIPARAKEWVFNKLNALAEERIPDSLKSSNIGMKIENTAYGDVKQYKDSGSGLDSWNVCCKPGRMKDSDAGFGGRQSHGPTPAFMYADDRKNHLSYGSNLPRNHLPGVDSDNTNGTQPYKKFTCAPKSARKFTPKGELKCGDDIDICRAPASGGPAAIGGVDPAFCQCESTQTEGSSLVLGGSTITYGEDAVVKISLPDASNSGNYANVDICNSQSDLSDDSERITGLYRDGISNPHGVWYDYARYMQERRNAGQGFDQTDWANPGGGYTDDEIYCGEDKETGNPTCVSLSNIGEINCNCWGTDNCKTGETDTTLCPAGYRDATDGGCTSATDKEPGPYVNPKGTGCASWCVVRKCIKDDPSVVT